MQGNHYFFRWFRISGYYNDIMYVYNKYLISMWATHVEKNHLLLSKYLNHLVCLTFHIYNLLLKWINSEEVWLDYCDFIWILNLNSNLHHGRISARSSRELQRCKNLLFNIVSFLLCILIQKGYKQNHVWDKSFEWL